ncbi:MAG: hypothetical protein CME70_13285 [Halobacteriovorax sp.]|nr:hypothetical protein [Halobacteriovorax sp.]|tara:strand:- start:67357 stop:68022 length:666 start_codon:yes stop_codon:yes gene_type:complete
MKLFLITLFSLTNLYASDFSLAGGGGVHLAKGFTSKTLNEGTSRPAIKINEGFGLHIYGENRFSSLSLFTHLRYSAHSSRAEYSYIDTDNPLVSGSASNLDSQTYFYEVDGGFKWYFFNLSNFYLFVSGGISIGFATIRYMEEDYILKTGGREGLIKGGSDVAGLFGYIGEAGFQINGSEFGTIFGVRASQQQTGTFDTLGGKRFKRDERSAYFTFFRVFN